MDPVGPDPAATAVLDPVQVRELDDLPRSERFGRLARFDEQSAHLLETLRSGHRRRDSDLVLASARSLAEAGRIVGAARLTGLCQALERAIRSADPRTAESLIGALPQARSDLLRALARHHQDGPLPPAGCPAP